MCQKVNRAVVFTDKAVAEHLHWYGGLQLMLDAGAINVKEFSSFEVGNVPVSLVNISSALTLFLGVSMY